MNDGEMRTERDQALFAGLQELAAGAFPKRCANCGRLYANLRQFLEETVPVAPQRSGLKASLDDDDRPVVELFRNCACGSTLMDFCRSRRDETADGQRRRETFARMLDQLVRRGMAAEAARAELLKVVHGGHSAVIGALMDARDDKD